jgi:hypothetical protein
MIPADVERFNELMDGVGETYNQTISPARKTIYVTALAEYDYDQVRAAIMRHIQKSRFLPTPADIREQIDGSDSDREGLAWSALTTAISRIGRYSSLIVEDPVVASAICITFGSWVGACESREGMHEAVWHKRRADFGAAMRTARRDPKIAKGGPRLLTGTCDAENRASRSTWAEGRTITTSVYGVLTSTGRVESKRLKVTPETLLPAMSLRAAIALPAGETVKLLPAVRPDPPPSDPAFEELTADEARERFSAKLADVIRSKGLGRRPPHSHGETPSIQVGDHPEPVPAVEGPTPGDADRGTAPRGEAPEAGSGVPIRKSRARQKLGVRSGVAGSKTGDRDRGRGIRQRDPRGRGCVDQARSADRQPATEQHRKTRRKAS